MKKIKFIESPKAEKRLEEKMFPEMFDLGNAEQSAIRGGRQASFQDSLVDDCDAVCLPSEWGGPCSCLTNLC